MTVAELLRRMSSAEISEWMALHDLEVEDARKSNLNQAAQSGLQKRKQKMRGR
jgi:hypothetical protein